MPVLKPPQKRMPAKKETEEVASREYFALGVLSTIHMRFKMPGVLLSIAGSFGIILEMVSRPMPAVKPSTPGQVPAAQDQNEWMTDTPTTCVVWFGFTLTFVPSVYVQLVQV